MAASVVDAATRMMSTRGTSDPAADQPSSTSGVGCFADAFESPSSSSVRCRWSAWRCGGHMNAPEALTTSSGVAPHRPNRPFDSESRLPQDTSWTLKPRVTKVRMGGEPFRRLGEMMS